MKGISKFVKTLLKDESAQGAVEYILLLVVVVAIGIIFKGQIISAVKSRLDDLSGGMNGFSTNQ